MDRIILPLGNGVAFYEKSRLCVSIIDKNGNKKVGGKNLKPLPNFLLLPIFRGFTFFFYGIWLYISAFFLMQEIEDIPENEKNKSFKIAKNVSIASTYILC